jgi:hypothetical protein
LSAGLAALALAFTASPAAGQGGQSNLVVQVTDVADTTPGEDLWQMSFLLLGFSLQAGQGFTVFFDPQLFRGLTATNSPGNADWDVLAVQPDTALNAPGYLDGLALTNAPAQPEPFIVSFIWMGQGIPGPLPFVIYNPDFTTAFAGETITAVPTPPALVCPTNLVVDAAPGRCDREVTFTVSATGFPAPVVVCIPPSGSVFGAGTNTVVCTASNELGVAQCAFALVVVDREAPQLLCPPDIATNVDASQCFASGVALGMPLAADHCGIPSVTNDAPVVFPAGVTPVVWTATDLQGNTVTCTQRVTVVDQSPPDIVCPPNQVVSLPPGATQGVVNYPPPVATDACGAVTVLCAPPSGSMLPLGETPVLCVATDAAGLTNACAFTVTVQRQPVAGTDWVGAVVNRPQSIRAAKLTANDSDEDGDALALTAVSGVSSNGGGVLLIGDRVQYTPPADFLGDDAFTYTLSDGRGGLATGLVQVRVSGDGNGGLNRIGSITMTPDGPRVRFAGIPQRSYALERSTDLQAWTVLATVTAAGDGVIEFVDTAPPPGMAFYRTRAL